MNSGPYRDGLFNLIGTEMGTCHIIGTGPSAEDYLDRIDPCDGVIGVNEASRLYDELDFLVIQDPRAIPKAWPFISPETRIILGARAAQQVPEGSTHGADRIHVCVFTHDLTADDPGRVLWYNCGILTGALSLAVALGFDRCLLHGCDFYGYRDAHYAGGIARAEKDRRIPLDGDRFTTPALRSMAAAVRSNADRWESMMEIRVLNPHSELRCFDGAQDLDPVSDKGTP